MTLISTYGELFWITVGEPCCWSLQSIAAEDILCITSPRMTEAPCCLSQERMLKDRYAGESFPGITTEGDIVALTLFFFWRADY